MDIAKNVNRCLVQFGKLSQSPKNNINTRDILVFKSNSGHAGAGNFRWISENSEITKLKFFGN